MTPHERALLAIYDLRELDRAREALQRAWEAPRMIFALGLCTPLRLGPPTPIHDPELAWLEEER